jgi:DNA-binding NarL/FixJ family response regulator
VNDDGVINMDILLADRQLKVRFALRVLLGRQADIEVVGEAGNAQETLAQAGEILPDVVLLDWGLCNGRTSDLLCSLRTAFPNLYVIALDTRPEAGQTALAAGADAFVSKAEPPDCLLSAIEYVRQRGEGAVRVSRSHYCHRGESDL